MSINPFLNVPDQGDDDPRYSGYSDYSYGDEEPDIDSICDAADAFMLAVYSVSEDFWNTYDIVGGDEPEFFAGEMHRILGTPELDIPDFVEGRTDKEYALNIYNAAKDLYDILYRNSDWDNFCEEYNIDIWMDICEETMDRMQTILAS